MPSLHARAHSASSLASESLRLSQAALALAICLLSSCTQQEGAAPKSQSSTNVLFIVTDTLRVDAIACYGGDLPTPNMDRLAARGVLFEDCTSHIPITVPSHSAMFTSRIPRVHGVLGNGQVLSQDHLTLAELMQASGRSTAAFVSLGVLAPHFGLSQGFDTYNADFSRVGWKHANEISASALSWLAENGSESFFLWTHYSDPHAPYGPPDPDDVKVELWQAGELRVSGLVDGHKIECELTLPPGLSTVDLRSPESDAGQIVISNLEMRGPGPACTGFLAGKGAKGKKKWWAQLPASLELMNPGTEATTVRLGVRLTPKQELAEKIAGYQAEVAYFDRYLGQLLDALEASGLDKNTLIVFTADHGESLGEHEQVGHIHQLFSESVHVPLILVPPRSDSWEQLFPPAGTVIDSPVAHIDILPTLVDLLGLPDSRARSGRSLRPLLEGGELEPAPILVETFRPQAKHDLSALISAGHKLTWDPEADTFTLYNLEADPGEQQDLSVSHPDLLGVMQKQLQELLKEADAIASDSEDRELGADEREAFDALGYGGEESESKDN